MSSEGTASSTALSSELALPRAAMTAEKLRFVVTLHENIIADLSECLAHAVKLRFSGFEQAEPLKFLKLLPEHSYAVLFSGGEKPCAGTVLFSIEFAQQVVANWFNLKKVSSDKSLTPLAESSFWRAAERLTRVFLSAYVNAGFGKASVVSRGRLRDITDALANSSEIAVFNYAVEMPAAQISSLAMCALLDAEMASRLVRPQSEVDSLSEEAEVAARVTHRLPIETKVLLGSFKVSLGELATIKPGDVIALPDQDEARLATADGVELFAVDVDLAGPQANFHLLTCGGDAD